MKVITEERLIALKKEYKGGLNRAILDWLINNECQEIDTLTVSKLRPMCDLQKDDHKVVLAAYREDGEDDIYFDITSGQCICSERHPPSTGEYIGWIPMPIYKPEVE